MQDFTLEIVECPACPVPAEVVDRFVLDSTHGPVEHAIVLCVLRHRFTVPAEQLVIPRPPGPSTIEGRAPTDRSSGGGRHRRNEPDAP